MVPNYAQTVSDACRRDENGTNKGAAYHCGALRMRRHGTRRRAFKHAICCHATRPAPDIAAQHVFIVATAMRSAPQHAFNAGAARARVHV